MTARRSADVIDIRTRGRKAPSPSLRLPKSIVDIDAAAGEPQKLGPEAERGFGIMLDHWLLYPLSMKSRNKDKRILQAEYRAAQIEGIWKMLDLSGAMCDRLGGITAECYNLIGSTPAKTPAAMAAKVRLVQEWGNCSGPTKNALDTLLADLDRMNRQDGAS